MKLTYIQNKTFHRPHNVWNRLGINGLGINAAAIVWSHVERCINIEISTRTSYDGIYHFVPPSPQYLV